MGRIMLRGWPNYDDIVTHVIDGHREVIFVAGRDDRVLVRHTGGALWATVLGQRDIWDDLLHRLAQTNLYIRIEQFVFAEAAKKHLDLSGSSVNLTIGADNDQAY